MQSPKERVTTGCWRHHPSRQQVYESNQVVLDTRGYLDRILPRVRAISYTPLTLPTLYLV